MLESDFTDAARAGADVCSVLIADDHAIVRETLKSLISAAFPRCRLVDFATAEAALAHCTLDAPHLAILDVTLPGIDGIEATRRMKALCPRTVIVIHTINDLPLYRDAARAAGATAFIGKGRDTRKLLPIIGNLLSR
jgi:DNA-binding NarL/FixJ family response regulator